MNNHEVNQLIEAIQMYLDGGSGQIPAEIASHQYAEECVQVNERLSRIAMILDSGGELEALQVAEAEPRLIDRAMLLSFGQESDWDEFCKRHGHEQAPPIDAGTLDALDALYQKGISSNHPLYTKYRGAVLSRNEDESYEIIKIIARLNPGDANAKRELQRLEHKVVMRLLEKLKKALKSEDETAVLQCLGEIESTRNREEYEDSAPYQSALELRNIIRRREAKAAIPRELTEADEQLAEGGSWMQAARIHAEAEAKIDRYGLTIDAGDAGKLEKIGGQLDQLRREAARLAKVSSLTDDLRRIAEEVEINLVTPDGLGHEFASSSLAKVLKYQREMVSLRGDLQAGDRARVDGAIGQLEQVLRRRRSRRKLRLVSVCTLVGVILLTASVFVWFSSQASKRAALLVKLQEDGQSVALRKQLDIIRDSDAVLLRFPKLSSQWAVSEQWVEGHQSAAAKVNKLLDKLEAQSDSNFSGSNPGDVYREMKEAEETVAMLPGDLRDGAAAKLMIIRNEADRFLSASQKKAATEALVVLQETAEQLGAIDPHGPVQVAKLVLDSCRPRIERLVKMSEQPAPILRLPVSVESQVTAVASRFTNVLAKTEEVLSALKEVNQADTIVGVGEEMKKLAAASYMEAELAKRVTEVFPDDRALRAFLLFNGDLSALAAAEKGVQAEFSRPEAAERLDRNVIQDLKSNAALVNLWDVRWTKRGAPRHAYSKGELKVRRVTGRKAGIIHEEWIGEVAGIPKYSGQLLKFREYKAVDPCISERRDEKFVSNNMTAVSQMIAGMNLDSLLDNTGSEYRRSIIPVIDQVFRNREAPPLAKAYIANSLFRLVRDRELEWGVHLVPSLISDMKEARAIEMEGQILASDWLTPKTSEIDSRWERYFKARLDRHYYRDFQLFRSLVKNLIAEPISLAAIVHSDGSAAINTAEVARVVWGLTLNVEGESVMQILGVVDAQSTKLTIPSNILPLSPLFAVQLENSEQQAFLLSLHSSK